ncbi:hypothetical protein PS15p_203084 [Mucor circinelloides]
MTELNLNATKHSEDDSNINSSVTNSSSWPQIFWDHPFSSFISKVPRSHRQGSTSTPYDQSKRTERTARNN